MEKLKRAPRALELLKAFNNQIRLDILNILQEEPCTVNEIVKKMNKGQSAVSQQLATLRYANLVHTKKNRTSITYSVNEEVVTLIKNFEKDVRVLGDL